MFNFQKPIKAAKKQLVVFRKLFKKLKLIFRLKFLVVKCLPSTLEILSKFKNSKQDILIITYAVREEVGNS